MKQFEIWWADLPKPVGRRPVLLLSRNDAYSYLNKFIAAEITTNVRNIPVEVPLGKREGLPKACAVNCDHLRTIARDRLKERVSAVAPARIPEIKRAVGYALGWNELMDVGDG